MHPNLKLLWKGTIGSVLIATAICWMIANAMAVDAAVYTRGHGQKKMTKSHSTGPWKTITITGYGDSCAIRDPETGKIGPSKTGLGASGKPGIPGKTAAADPKVFPLGSVVRIAGFGDFHITDTGPIGHHIDIFLASCEEAIQLGRQKTMRARRVL